MHRYRSDTHRYYKILTHMHRYEHLILDPEIRPKIGSGEIGPEDWTWRLVPEHINIYAHICTDICIYARI